MADVEETHFTSLADRIAALNRQKKPASDDPPGKRRPPPPPPPSATNASSSHNGRAVDLPPRSAPRSAPSNPPPLPRRDTQTCFGSDGAAQEPTPAQKRSVPPPLPSRTPSAGPSIPERPQRTSTQSSLVTTRRGSATPDMARPLTASPSLQSQGRFKPSKPAPASNGSAQRKLPPAVSDPSSLPPLPPSRRDSAIKAQESEPVRPTRMNAPRSASIASSNPAPPPRPVLPPRVPSRPVKSPGATQPNGSAPEEPKIPPRKMPPLPVQGFGNIAPSPQRSPVPNEPPSPPTNDAETPPPIPLASRPSAAQIDAASAKTATTTPPQQIQPDCWVCRDWSGPDSRAAQFPRESLPRNDPVGHLAQGLCAPFPSYTDKARAIFTWFHHNIKYDTVAFFGNNVKSKSVEETIFGGWAVCQGYADTFKAIANRAGLDCIVVPGHGKGFGHTPLTRGQTPPPPQPDGHAWNAVRIDGGGWKLVDACWGAGHICGTNRLYKQEFSPAQFTASNETFGLRHFPRDPAHQFRADGRVLSWEEYFRGPVDGEPPVFYTSGHEEGIAEDSVQPRERDIALRDDGDDGDNKSVRFQFSKICEHWTSEKHGLGKPPLLLLSVHGLDGRSDEMLPMQTNGYWHWIDVDARRLGTPGQSVQVAQLTTMDNRDARGVTASEFLAKRGRVGMSWSYVVRWELV